ncbi:hypothetical protein VTN31DRAFT_6250 [Thermomyces dupontii]|uniref:uncharacterized protein n=1 Tax=Talaromyces thermophilus TaxID=28565 RepID=UPI00374488E0
MHALSLHDSCAALSQIVFCIGLRQSKVLYKSKPGAVHTAPSSRQSIAEFQTRRDTTLTPQNKNARAADRLAEWHSCIQAAVCDGNLI